MAGEAKGGADTEEQEQKVHPAQASKQQIQGGYFPDRIAQTLLPLKISSDSPGDGLR